jgi:hypothetical protein
MVMNSDLSTRYLEETGEEHHPHGTWDNPLRELNGLTHAARLPAISAIVNRIDISIRLPAMDLPTPFLRRHLQFKLNPRGCVVTRVGFPPDPAIDAGGAGPIGERLVEQQVIDSQARVSIPVLAKVIPERENCLSRMERPD